MLFTVEIDCGADDLTTANGSMLSGSNPIPSGTRLAAKASRLPCSSKSKAKPSHLQVRSMAS